jgi:16S rRNA (uracil1498-N3)-methyltransferase
LGDSLITLGEASQERIRRQISPLVIGAPLRLAVRNCCRVRAIVTQIEAGAITLRITERLPPLARRPVYLVVAVPRPQTVKKVISLAVQAGIQQVFFVKSFHTVPSYLQSHSLLPDAIDAEIIKAMEQVWESHPSHIDVLPSMQSFFEQKLSPLLEVKPNITRVLAEPLSPQTTLIDTVLGTSKGDVLIALGPEKGWSSREMSVFESRGFTLAHIDDREYRVETALGLLLGKIVAVPN